MYETQLILRERAPKGTANIAQNFRQIDDIIRHHLITFDTADKIVVSARIDATSERNICTGIVKQYRGVPIGIARVTRHRRVDFCHQADFTKQALCLLNAIFSREVSKFFAILFRLTIENSARKTNIVFLHGAFQILPLSLLPLQLSLKNNDTYAIFFAMTLKLQQYNSLFSFLLSHIFTYNVAKIDNNVVIKISSLQTEAKEEKES